MPEGTQISTFLGKSGAKSPPPAGLSGAYGGARAGRAPRRASPRRAPSREPNSRPGAAYLKAATLGCSGPVGEVTVNR
jgi:hypothetical protein